MAHDHESIEYGLDEVKEVFNASVLTGTIVSVDTENDKADVDISGFGLISAVSIFYHCGGESTVEGGAQAFEEGDSVYILNKKGIVNPSVSDLKIIGFVDGLKECEFYIDVTINTFIPAYYKTVKLIDNDGMVHIKDSSIEEPSKVGPFSNVAFPAKVYLYMVGNAPIITDDTGMLFSYFTENPVKEFTVRVETWQEGATIAVNGIVLGNGDQQKFSWDFTSKTWSPVSGGVDKNTTKFMASKTNPSSTGYNQACKEEVVNAYEGTRILLTGEGEGNPQTMGEIYDYLMSAKKVSNSFYHCDLYKPYYGLLENEPIYGPPFETELEEYYRIAAWRVPYLLADDETIAKPEDPINFTALRTGSLMVKKTVVPHCHCEWVIEEKTWEGNPENIKYNPYPNNASTAYLIAAIMKIELGSLYYDTPHNCYGKSGWYWCEDNLGCNTQYKTKIGSVVVPQMGIMTDSNGHNTVFDLVTLNVDYTGQSAYCGYYDPETETWTDVCINDMPLNAGAIRYEFKMLPTPENRI